MISVLPNNISKEPQELMAKVSYETMKKVLVNKARAKNLPVEIVQDSYGVTYGSLFGGLLSKSTPCLAIYHTKHKKDYYSLLVEFKESYGEYFIFVHFGGKSRNERDINMGKRYTSIGLNNELREYHPGTITRMFSSRAESKMQDEEMYYDAVYKMIIQAAVEAEAMTLDPSLNVSEQPASQPKVAPQPKAAPRPKTAPQPKVAPQPTRAPETPTPAYSEPVNKEISDRRLDRNIGVLAENNEFITVVEAGTVLPVTKDMIFSTAFDGQTSVKFKVAKGEKMNPSSIRVFDEYIAEGIPFMKKGEPSIVISVSVNYFGTISISAKETKSNIQLKTVSVSAHPNQEKATYSPVIFPIPIEKSDTDPVKWAISDIRLQTEDGYRPIVIGRETYIPTKHSSLLEFVPNSKRTATVQVIESIGSRPEINRLIGTITVENITTDKPYAFMLDVDFKGNVSVTVTDPRTNDQLPAKFAIAPQIAPTAQSIKQPPVNKPVPQISKQSESRVNTAAKTEEKGGSLQQLKELADLFERGILTKEEFETMKKKIIYG